MALFVRLPLLTLRWTLGPVTEQRHTPRADEGPIMLQLTDSQQCVLSIQPVDAKGLEAPVFGTPVWSSSDATVATVQPHSGGLAVDLVAVKPGTTQISVTAQVDEAADALTGTLDVTVIGGQAVALTIGNTAPTAQ